MNTLQKHFKRIGEATLKTRAGDVEELALESQKPMFVKKIFSTSQSFNRNIKSWEGPVKSSFPIGATPLTDW